jgi:hypothetical protein
MRRDKVRWQCPQWRHAPLCPKPDQDYETLQTPSSLTGESQLLVFI